MTILVPRKQPAEWAKQRACWLAWPAAEDLWQEHLPSAQSEFVGLCRAIASSEQLEVLVRDAAAMKEAQLALQSLPVRFHIIPYGDIWMRDIAPIFMQTAKGIEAVCFKFNGWGGKYSLPFDQEVNAHVAKASSFPTHSCPWVLEGGAMETDGEGTLITTEQCVLNPNRFEDGKVPAREVVEQRLCDAFGASKVLWITQGLLNDHTDGHVDTIARFIKPGVVVCMQATDKDDPNAKVMDQIAHELEGAVDARGQKIKVERVPSPGAVLNDEGDIMPASYMNFYISNDSVIVPIYSSVHDAAALKKIASLFPERKTVGLPAKAILSGGGAFHCITQQEPLV